MATQSLLSIDALQSDLKHAEQKHAEATADRLRAQEIENQWTTEVNSLRSLIEVRKMRLSPGNGGYQYQTSEVVPPEGPSTAVTHVEWISGLLEAAGRAGVSPPEILRAAEKSNVKMHRNYPYVVLSHMLEKGKVTKREGRYY